ncbi:hypothetical protein [Rhodococcus sp. IEGM 1305]|uniref:hypothetical protein n=1 Tax=Rhodococcus sp. IEGM 1305 TaxID=3047092 RepID=UPI0024B85B24|nr:hypothetical protein [Rhodococcus sp. IEGM 1305]MDI9953291.1 hypothetical protein [Rhodococcus sp. IEGM 1305]
MIYPGVDEALRAIIHTVEDEIAPHVEDDLAQSRCRTVAQMLRSVQVRVREETQALAADNTDLRELFAEWSGTLPADVAPQVAAALADPAPAVYPSLTDLQADAVRLREALVHVIEAVPDSGDPIRKTARNYLRRQLGREKAWMQDAFTGPRR